MRQLPKKQMLIIVLATLAAVSALLCVFLPSVMAVSPDITLEQYESLKPFPNVSDKFPNMYTANVQTLIIYSTETDKFKLYKHDNYGQLAIDTEGHPAGTYGNTIYINASNEESRYFVYERQGLDGQWTYVESKNNGGFQIQINNYVVYTSVPLKQDGLEIITKGWVFYEDEETIQTPENQIGGLYWDVPDGSGVPSKYYDTQMLYYNKVSNEYMVLTQSEDYSANPSVIWSGYEEGIYKITWRSEILENHNRYRYDKSTGKWVSVSTNNKGTKYVYYNMDIIRATFDIKDINGNVLVYGGKNYIWEKNYDNTMEDIARLYGTIKTTYTKSADETVDDWILNRMVNVYRDLYDSYYYDGTYLIMGRDLTIKGIGYINEQPHHVIGFRGINENVLYRVITNGNSIELYNIKTENKEIGDIAVPWDLTKYYSFEPIKYHGTILGNAYHRPNIPSWEYARWEELETAISERWSNPLPEYNETGTPGGTPGGVEPAEPTPTPTPESTPDPWEGSTVPEIGGNDDIGGMAEQIDSAMENMTNEMEQAISQVDMTFNISDFIGGMSFVNTIFVNIWDGLGSWKMIITIPIFMGIALTFVGRTARVKTQNARMKNIRSIKREK